MSDPYMIDENRFRRSKGLKEIGEICQDILFIHEEVSYMKFKYFNRILLRKFYNDYMESLGEKYKHGMLEHILEGYNCAYEKIK